MTSRTAIALLPAVLFAICTPAGLRAQCSNNNVFYTSSSPACPGSVVVPCMWGGEYVTVNVTAGTTYTFSTCGGAGWDTYLTLYAASGGAALAWNDDFCGAQSQITWTATFTGQVNILLDQWTLFNPCASNTTCANLTISCTTPPPPPVGDCVYVLALFDSWGDGWGTSSVGVSINGGPFTYYTVTASSNQVLIGVNINDVVVLTYNNSGAWQGENSYTLSLQGGGLLFSSGSPPAPGINYAGTVNCAPPPSPPEDCVGGFTICNNQGFNANTNNTGQVADLNAGNYGCLLDAERQGTWYNFSPSSSGNVAFSIDPSNPADDYDFAIWGPYPPGSSLATICPPLGQPLRCSYAAPSGSTGLNYSATDLSEGAFGDKWVRYLTVNEGEVYLLYISNWSQSGLAFDLNWDLTNGASLDCTVLPLQLLVLEAHPDEDVIQVEWAMLTGPAVEKFTVERAATASPFLPIGEIPATDQSSTTHYRFTDAAPGPGTNIYRLRATYADGTEQRSHEVAASLHRPNAGLRLYPNPAEAHFLLTTTADVEGAIAITLLDPLGRTVLRQQATQGIGGRPLRIDLIGIAPGSYLVQVRDQQGLLLGTAPLIKE